MKFQYMDYKVDIGIEKYEFNDIKNLDFEDDRNWLIVKVVYQKEKGSKTIKKDAALLVSELVDLREWFYNIQFDNNIDDLNFLEPCLSFSFNQNFLTIELCFELSLYDKGEECTEIKLHLDSKNIQDYLEELDRYIKKFPSR